MAYTITNVGGYLKRVDTPDSYPTIAVPNITINNFSYSNTVVSTSTGVNPVESQYSLYGNTIPLSVFGVGRIGGEIISGPWVENGLASFIISFGVPADPSGTRVLREIAFDSEVIWTGSLIGAGTPASSGFSTEPITCRFYDGTLTQAADALETTHFGADAVAYRPQMLLAFDKVPLESTKFGKIPYVSAVIADTQGDDVNLGEAFERLAYSPWVGYTSSQFETSGITDGLTSGGLIIAQQADFLSTIQSFGRFYPKWSILQTDKLRIVDRGSTVTPDLILDINNLTDQVLITRQEPNSAPGVLELSTIDPGADFSIVLSRAQSPRDPVAVTTSVATDSQFLPAIMDADTRISIVTYTKHHEDRARKQISLTAMMAGLEVEPGDLLGVENLSSDFPGGEVFRVLETLHGANYQVEITAESILQCEVSSLTGPLPVVPIGSFTTWDPATASNVTFSGGNLSVTNTGTTSADQGARSPTTSGQTSGKYYFECEFTATTSLAAVNMGVGIGTVGSSFTDMGGSATTGNEVFAYTGRIWAGGSQTSFTIPGINQSQIIGIAVNLDDRKIWFKRVTDPYSPAWNNVAHDDPATGSGGVSIPAGTMVPFVTFGGPRFGSAAGNVITANFGASSFYGAVPSGYMSGWPL
ncbi:phage tail protein [Bradyrhizobium elkanii]|uniref:phage tail protein n=1 Tax=Bradyrhizobium elkanii TaxID=29448 RepID=UPI00272D3590|nr:phage tail protein [Bradyrhizobium elkanii]WLA80276.1 phage tail protein [Bradyrhizobium elkanii]